MLAFLRKTALWIMLIPSTIFSLGVASNQAVTIANGDRFPVLLSAGKIHQIPSLTIDPDGVAMLDDIHCVMTPQTHLNALADIFDEGGMCSIGDFMLDLGSWLFSYAFIVWLTVLILRVRD